MLPNDKNDDSSHLVDFSPSQNVSLADVPANPRCLRYLAGSMPSHNVSLAGIFAGSYQQSCRFCTNPQCKLQHIRCRYFHQFVVVLLIFHLVTMYLLQMSSLLCITFVISLVPCQVTIHPWQISLVLRTNTFSHVDTIYCICTPSLC